MTETLCLCTPLWTSARTQASNGHLHPCSYREWVCENGNTRVFSRAPEKQAYPPALRPFPLRASSIMSASRMRILAVLRAFMTR